jgi:hypothetical protein
VFGVSPLTPPPPSLWREVALSQAEGQLRGDGPRPPNPQPEQARSPSPRGSPICFIWTRESESKEEFDLIWTQEPESKEEPDLFWTQESESKGESDLLWTPEPNGLQIQIQNQMDSVRSLVSPPSSPPRSYGWIGQESSSGFSDRPRGVLGVFASLDRL